MYIITDDHGTRVWALTRADALDWLRYCSNSAVVTNFWGRIVAIRKQGI